MIFRRWFIIRSKWFVSFIQRGNNTIIPVTFPKVKGNDPDVTRQEIS